PLGAEHAALDGPEDEVDRVNADREHGAAAPPRAAPAPAGEVVGVAPEAEIAHDAWSRPERAGAQRGAQLARGAPGAPLEHGDDVRHPTEARELGVARRDRLLDEDEAAGARERLGLLDVMDRRAADRRDGGVDREELVEGRADATA